MSPQSWQTRSDLKAYLGALAVIGRQKGGGRVFSKEKHSYFDHDEGAVPPPHPRLASASASPAFATAADDSAADDDAASHSRPPTRPATAKLSARTLTHTAAAGSHTPVGSSIALSSPASSFDIDSDDDEDAAFLPLSSTQPLFASALSARLTGSFVLSHDALPLLQEHKESLMQSALSPPPVLSRRASRTSTPFLSLRSLPASGSSLDVRSAALIGGIQVRHEEGQREAAWTGSRGEAARRKRDGAVVEGSKNLFSGVRDKFYHTFSELKDMQREEEEEKAEAERAKKAKAAAAAAAGKGKRKASPPKRDAPKDGDAATRPSSAQATQRPLLPSASALRPSTAGSSSLLGRPTTAVERRALPPSFPYPPTVDTFVQLGPIVRLPPSSLSPSLPTAPATVEVLLPLPPSPGSRPSTAGSDATPDVAPVERPPSVYRQQRDERLKAHFLHFLSATEPQMWTVRPRDPAPLTSHVDLLTARDDDIPSARGSLRVGARNHRERRASAAGADG